MPHQNRRRNTRHTLDKAVKVLCLDTGKYISGSTLNISTTGALLKLNSPSLLVPGQQIQIGISWTPSQTILNTKNLTNATVLRSLGHQATQHVALQFNPNHQIAIPA